MYRSNFVAFSKFDQSAVHLFIQTAKIQRAIDAGCLGLAFFPRTNLFSEAEPAPVDGRNYFSAIWDVATWNFGISTDRLNVE